MSSKEYGESLDSIFASIKSHLMEEQPSDIISAMVSFLSNTYAADGTLLGAAASRTSKGAPSSKGATSSSEGAAEPEPIPAEEKALIKRAAGRRRRAICAEPIDNVSLTEPLAEPAPKKLAEEEERIDRALKKNIMFAHLEDDERRQVYEHMRDRSVSAGTVLIKQGDEGDFFYVIDSGSCEVWKSIGGEEPKLVLTIPNGGSFGELALIYNSPRAATVKAATDCKLWVIDRLTYKKILMGATMRKREMYESFLEKVPILSTLGKYERLTVADALEPVTFEANEVIIREGDLGDVFYIIIDGSVKVLQKPPDGGPAGEVGRLSDGDYFGEIALLTNRPRAASVVAVGRCKCVQMERERFVRVMGPCVDLLRRNIEMYNRYMTTKI